MLANAGVGYFTTKGGSAVNNGTITAKVMEQESVINLGASLGLNEANTFYSDANSMMGLDAFDHGYVSNESGGSIEMYGRGNVGMLAIDESTAENAGQITLMPCGLMQMIPPLCVAILVMMPGAMALVWP